MNLHLELMEIGFTQVPTENTWEYKTKNFGIVIVSEDENLTRVGKFPYDFDESPVIIQWQNNLHGILELLEFWIAQDE